MNTLILSVSAGGGHLHAAEAIKSYIELNCSESKVEIFDTIKYINPLLDKLVIGGYLKTIKITPTLYGKLYRYAENDEGISNLSSKINKLLTHKLLPLIKEKNPDIIVSTHFFPTEMLSILKTKYKLNIPIVTVITDYAPHSIWLHKNIDAYVVADNGLIDEMEQKGINRSTIYSLGIPVKPNFMNKYDILKTLKSLEFDPIAPTILIMGGALGMGNIVSIYEKLCLIERKLQIIIITGNNKKLFNEVSKLAENSIKPTKILGYTKEVNKYMQASSLLITKPGGLTISEALISKIPIALFSPIPGQEERNAEFLIKNNLAIDLGDGENCKEIIEHILFDEKALNNMKANCEIYSKPNCSEEIIKLLNSLVEQRYAAVTKNT